MPGWIATVGTFDGLHKGHRAIISQLLQRARETGLEPSVITFRQHPLSIIAPHRAPSTVMAREEVERQLHNMGIKNVVMLDVNAALLSLTAREFLAMLRTRYNVKKLVMGFDNTFGSDRLHTHQEYTQTALAEGMSISFVDPVVATDGSKISSSLLRHALKDGDMERVKECLNHYPSISGVVAHGKENGRKIGFPTLNIAPFHQLPISKGVYVASMEYEGKTYHGVLNVGNNPTFGESNSLTYELHIPGHDLGNMYGKKVTVRIHKFLRKEKKFENIEALISAINENIIEMNKYFSTKEN